MYSQLDTLELTSKMLVQLEYEYVHAPCRYFRTWWTMIMWGVGDITFRQFDDMHKALRSRIRHKARGAYQTLPGIRLLERIDLMRLV